MNFTSTHLSYLLALSCIFLLILLFKVRASKPIRLVRENSDNSQTNRDHTNLIEQKSKRSMEFFGPAKKSGKNWIHHNDLAGMPSTNDL